MFVPKFRAVAMPFAPPLENLLLEKVFDAKGELIGYGYKGPKPLTVRMPQGNSDDLFFVQTLAISVTLIGMVFLNMLIFQKASEQVRVCSDFGDDKKKKKE